MVEKVITSLKMNSIWKIHAEAANWPERECQIVAH